MADYDKPSIGASYNQNPPPDDGTETAANEITWSKHLTKLANPLKSFIDAVNDAVEARFAVTPDYDQTQAEIDAGVTPSDTKFEAYDPRRLNFLPSNSAADNKVALAAMASVGGQYEIQEPGTYAFDPSVTFSSKIVIKGKGRATILQPSGPSSSGPILDFTVAGSGIENLHIDCQNVDDYQVIGLSGDRTYCDVSMDGMGAKSSPGSGNIAGVVCDTGDKSRVRVDAWGFANGGASNGSFPRVVAINAGADEVQVEYFRADSCQAGIAIANGAVRPQLQYVECHNMADNGVYNLGSTDLVCGQFTYDGDEEGWVEVGTRSVIHSFYGRIQAASSGLLGLQDATNLIIGDMVLIDVESSSFVNLIRTRSGNTTTDGVWIKNLTMISRSDTPISLTTGAVNNVRIDNWDIEHHYVNASQKKNIYSHTTGDQVRFGTVSIKVVDDTAGLTGSDNFSFAVPSSLTKLSFIQNFLADVDGGDYGVRLTNTAQDNFFTGIGQQIDSSQRIIVPNNTRPRKVLFGNGAPSAGDWLRGDIVLDITPSASGTIGVVCVTGGSPGTWKTFGSISA